MLIFKSNSGLNSEKMLLRGWLQPPDKASGRCFYEFLAIFMDKKQMKCNQIMRKQLLFFALLFVVNWSFPSRFLIPRTE
jgi:hypothetical protein